MKRRIFLISGAVGTFSLVVLGFLRRFYFLENTMADKPVIREQFPLDFQWPTQEPYLFCVHHDDHYPKGNGQFGPARELLAGRNLGQDFTPRDGFRMYHGEDVPGFPVHPHRGFETITIVRRGLVDHADSMGSAGRYGGGDVQWMTAGGGVQHSEMFPLLKTDGENHMEMFQIWLNLPRQSKMVPPAFKMFWAEKIPKVQLAASGGSAGEVTGASSAGEVTGASSAGEVTVIAGEYAGVKAIAPPPNSWASNPDSEALILIVKLQAGAEIELPVSSSTLSRTLYFFEGSQLSVNGTTVTSKTGLNLSSQVPTKISTQGGAGEFLVLQAKPIGEPVVQYGPFVMNTKEEISQAIQDYQRTQFGGWSWGRHDMVHGPKPERFAKYPAGHIEKPV